MKKVLLYIAIGIGAFFLLAWAVAEFSEGWVKGKLQDKVSKATEGRLYFDFDEIDLELFSPALYAYGVSFRDTVQGKPRIELAIDTFLIKGVDWTSIPSDGPVYFEQLTMRSVQLNIDAADTAQFRQYFQDLGNSRKKKPALRPKEWNLYNASADVGFGNNLWKVTNLTAAGTYSDTLTDGIGFLQHLDGVNVVEIEARVGQENWLYASRIALRRDSISGRIQIDSLHILPKNTQFDLAFKNLGIGARIPVGEATGEPYLIDTLLAEEVSILELPQPGGAAGGGKKKKFQGLEVNTLMLPDIAIQTPQLKASLNLQGKQLQMNPEDSLPLRLGYFQLKGQDIEYTRDDDLFQLDSLYLLAEEDTLHQLQLNSLQASRKDLQLNAEALQFNQAPLAAWFNKEYRLGKAYARNVSLKGQLPEQQGGAGSNQASRTVIIDELDINQLNSSLTTPKGANVSFNQANLHLEGLKKENDWQWNRLQLSATTIRYKGKQSPNDITVDEFSLNDQTAIVRGIELGRPNPLEQANSTFFLTIPHVKISGWHPDQLVNNQVLFIQSVNVLRPNMLAAMDQSRDKPDKEIPFIIKRLHEAPLKLYIADIQLYDGKITYSEKLKKDAEAGELLFTEVSAGLTNLTNLPYKIRQNSTLQLDFQTRLMDAAPGQTRIWFDLNPPNYAFQAVGGVDSLHAEELNPITAYVSPVVFDEGMLYKSRWQLDGNPEKTSGKIWLEYDNLNVEISGKSNADTSGLFKELKEFVLQKGFLDEERSIYNPVSFTNEADPTRSFINYYWRSILSGLKIAIDAPGSGG